MSYFCTLTLESYIYNIILYNFALLVFLIYLITCAQCLPNQCIYMYSCICITNKIASHLSSTARTRLPLWCLTPPLGFLGQSLMSIDAVPHCLSTGLTWPQIIQAMGMRSISQGGSRLLKWPGNTNSKYTCALPPSVWPPSNKPHKGQD